MSLQDVLPSGLSFLSSGGSGTYTNSTGVWNVGSVTNGSTQTLTIVATVVTSAPTTLTASVSHSDEFDANQANNTASVTETPQKADLVVSDTISATAPNVGDTVTYTVTVIQRRRLNAATQCVPAGSCPTADGHVVPRVQQRGQARTRASERGVERRVR